jgi:hypothetical protein
MPSAADDRLLSGPAVALRGLERQGLAVRVIEPPFDLGPPVWRLTAEGIERSLALLETTARRAIRPTTTESVLSGAG